MALDGTTTVGGGGDVDPEDIDPQGDGSGLDADLLDSTEPGNLSVDHAATADDAALLDGNDTPLPIGALDSPYGLPDITDMDAAGTPLTDSTGNLPVQTPLDLNEHDIKNFGQYSTAGRDFEGNGGGRVMVTYTDADGNPQWIELDHQGDYGRLEVHDDSRITTPKLQDGSIVFADRYGSINDAVAALPSDGGRVVVPAGTYTISSSVSLGDREELVGMGTVEIEPTADIDGVRLEGSNCAIRNINFNDPNGNTGSTPALALDGATHSVVEDVVIRNWHDGVYADADPNANGDVWENELRHVHVTDIPGTGFKFQGEYHDNNHRNLFANRCDVYGIHVDTNGVDGGNKFHQVIGIDCGADGIRIDGMEESWWSSLVADGNSGQGIFISDHMLNRLFMQNVWASTNGDCGVKFDPTNGGDGLIADVYIDGLYAWNNTNFGILTASGDGTGEIRRLWMDRVALHDNKDGSGNGVGARFDAGTHNEVHLQWVHTRNHPQRGIDGGGGRGVSVHYADCQDGKNLLDPAIKRWNGTGLEEAGAGNSPTASQFDNNETVENTDDNTLWYKDASGSMRQVI
jgi:hypothetical protein